MAKPGTSYTMYTPDEQYREETRAFRAEVAASGNPGWFLMDSAIGYVRLSHMSPAQLAEFDRLQARYDDIRRRCMERHGELPAPPPPPPVLRVRRGDAVTINGHRFTVESVDASRGVIDTLRCYVGGGSTSEPCDGEGLEPDPPELGPVPPEPGPACEGTLRQLMARHRADLGDRVGGRRSRRPRPPWSHRPGAARPPTSTPAWA